VAESDDPSYAALRGRYTALVHERDRLQEALERAGQLVELRVTCDRGCGTAFTVIAPPPIETQLASMLIGAGWRIEGMHHICRGCSQRKP